jgi:hypothetical protein
MIPNETLQTIDTVGATAVVGNFKITDATQARILVSLSDKMYTRKQLAAVREYSTNAADAHRVVSRPISEILVTLPTMEDLNLRIRDFGTGLTEDQIRNVYCVFGESTKRNSNEFNGLLGYGCKAGFASADSFIVSSFINGEKSVYQCIKGDSTKLHSAMLLSREASAEPSGIEITIPVKQGDLWTFHREAVDFYKYWPELPTIVNLTDEEKVKLDAFRSVPATLKGEGWEIRPAVNGAKGVAYMGWVPYAIDWSTLYHRMSLDAKKRVLFELLQKNEVTLYFAMGEVQFVDSREHLEYTDLTLSALIKRIESIFDKIRDSIQEKFTGVSNLWEAKKMYNAIFGTGILETEKGEECEVGDRIKILDGNLLQLESTFSGSFTWNGIALDGPEFDDLHQFDNARPGILCSSTPMEPVLLTYRKKKNRAKVCRCKEDANNSILASNNVVVIVNDTGVRTGLSMVSRYFIFGRNAGIRTVHILTFRDGQTRDLFYKETHFDSVPVVYLSAIIAEAKVWHNANKVSRGYRSGGGGGGGTRTMKYIDIEEQSVEESEVPVREIEEGNFYVEMGEGRRRASRVVLHDNCSEDPSDVASAVSVLAEALDLDIERVFIINRQTSSAKWFEQAVESGDWIGVWGHIKENLGVLNAVELLNADKYDDFSAPCDKAVAYLKSRIMDKNSPMLKVLDVVPDKTQDKNMAIVRALRELHLWDIVVGGHSPTIDYTALKAAAIESYPYLSWSHVENDYHADEDNLAKVAHYVNAMDLYVDLTRPVVVPPPAMVEETENKESVAA